MMADTFPLCHCEKTLFALPTFFPHSPTSGLRSTKRKVWRMANGGVGEKEKNKKVGVVPLGSKASCLPSTLGHSLGATLAFGGMGVNCHWCHSAINHVVTRSDGLRVVERKPPAKRHMGKSPHLFIPTSEALHRLISWGNSSVDLSVEALEILTCTDQNEFLKDLLLGHNWTKSDVEQFLNDSGHSKYLDWLLPNNKLWLGKCRLRATVSFENSNKTSVKTNSLHVIIVEYSYK